MVTTWSTGVLAAVLIGVFQVTAYATPPASLGVGSLLLDDTKYLVDSVQLDMQDVATAPIHTADQNSALRSPRFYLAVAGVGALLGGSFALDQTMRGQLHNMSSSDANLLQNVSYASLFGGTAALYGYGLSGDDVRARHYALTSAESAGIASLAVVGIKAAFGRRRPYQAPHSHTKFFDGGTSFVSGEVTPGFGRMGHDGMNRPRPNLDPWGFPSAHVFSLVVLLGCIGYVIGTSAFRVRWRWLGVLLCGLIVCFVAFSRMYLDAHWLSADSASASPTFWP